jgi:hypothetical protein
MPCDYDFVMIWYLFSIYTIIACFGFVMVAPGSVNDECRFQASVIQVCIVYVNFHPLTEPLQTSFLFSGLGSGPQCTTV